MYSPKIDEKYIPVLYKLGKELHKPMTHLVNDAVKDYLEKYKATLEKNREDRLNNANDPWALQKIDNI